MPIDARGYQIAGWVGVVFLLVATAAAGMTERWWGLAGLALVSVAAVVFLLLRSRLPSLFSLLFVVAGILNGLGWVFNMWQRVPYFDPFTHAFTSFGVTLAIGYLVYGSVTLHVRRYATFLFALNVAALGVSLGAGWEIFEWSIGVPQTYQSVAIDLIADLIGAAAAAALAVYAFTRVGTERGPEPE